jgi:hypothetical protein
LGIPGALIIGGPRYSNVTVAGMAVALLIAAQVLWAISHGHARIPIAALALLAAIPGLYILYVAWSLLLDQPVARDVAARYVANHLDTNPERSAARCATVSSWADRKLNALLPPNPTKRVLYGGETVYSAIFDFNDAPFYKSFLRIDVSKGDLTISCFGVTDVGNVRLEDEVRWHRVRGWTKARARLVDPKRTESFGSADLYWENTGQAEIALDLGGRVALGTILTVTLKPKAEGADTVIRFEYCADELRAIPAAAGTRFREIVVSIDSRGIGRGDFL